MAVVRLCQVRQAPVCTAHHHLLLPFDPHDIKGEVVFPYAAWKTKFGGFPESGTDP